MGNWTSIATNCLQWARQYIWHIPEGFAGLVAGFLVLLAAFVAWKGVQSQIGAERESLDRQLAAQEELEAERAKKETAALKAALHAELFMYSRMVIDAASQLNYQCKIDPNAPAFAPAMVPPTVFPALLDRVGLLGEGLTISAIVTFYTNLTAIIADSQKAIEYTMAHGGPDNFLPPALNPFVTTHGFLARQFRLLATNLATALNGLSNTRYRVTPDIDLTKVYAPDGTPLAISSKPPSHIDGVLTNLGI